MLSKWATSFELPCSPCAAQDGRVRFNPNLYVNGKVGNSMRVMFAVCAAVWLLLCGRVYGLLNLFGCHSALSRGLPFDLGYMGRAVLDFAHNISDSLASSLLMPACLS